MKFLLALIAAYLVVTPAIAAKREPASNQLKKQVEDTIRKGIASELTFKVETSKASICGGEEMDAIFVTAFVKKMKYSENGPQEIKEELDHFSAYAADYKKSGFKAFMRDNQCME